MYTCVCVAHTSCASEHDIVSSQLNQVIVYNAGVDSTAWPSLKLQRRPPSDGSRLQHSADLFKHDRLAQYELHREHLLQPGRANKSCEVEMTQSKKLRRPCQNKQGLSLFSRVAVTQKTMLHENKKFLDRVPSPASNNTCRDPYSIRSWECVTLVPA